MGRVLEDFYTGDDTLEFGMSSKNDKDRTASLDSADSGILSEAVLSKDVRCIQSPSTTLTPVVLVEDSRLMSNMGPARRDVFFFEQP